MSFTGFSYMNICLKMSTSQIHKKIKLDKKIKINMQLYFESPDAIPPPTYFDDNKARKRI